MSDDAPGAGAVPSGADGVTIRLLVAEETHRLRRAALRGGDPTAVVHQDTDDGPATWHLGAVTPSGRVVGTSTFFPEPFPLDPARRGAVRLRSMAVDDGWRGRGLGSAILAAAEARLVAQGAELLWANARDSALGFYDRAGFTETGRAFVDPLTGLGHTVVVRALGPPNGSEGARRQHG
jgi:GNAT superfamily N-acetyltransferase